MATLAKSALSFIGGQKADRVKGRGWFDRRALAAALAPDREEHVVLAQTAGFPAAR